ncbi:MAG TPA: hypothetical protein VF137_10565 [Candidatus Dormibacteraeota bacterium]
MARVRNRREQAKLTLKRESLRELSAGTLRDVAGGFYPSEACPVSVQVYCTYTVVRGVTCICLGK